MKCIEFWWYLIFRLFGFSLHALNKSSHSIHINFQFYSLRNDSRLAIWLHFLFPPFVISFCHCDTKGYQLFGSHLSCILQFYFWNISRFIHQLLLFSGVMGCSFLHMASLKTNCSILLFLLLLLLLLLLKWFELNFFHMHWSYRCFPFSFS